MSRPDYGRPGGPWNVAPLSLLPPPALVDGPSRATSEQVADRAAHVAGYLARNGVRPGDVVAFHLPNSWQAVVASFAVWRLGAVAFPIHHRVPLPAAQVVAQRGGARHLLQDGAIFNRARTTPHRRETVDPASEAVLLATSGSSGHPKVVRHTHRALAYKARVMVDAHGLTPDDVVLMPAPLSHVSGLLNGVLLPGQARMKVVLMERWVPALALDLIEREQVSFMIGPPTFFTDLVDDPTFTRGKVSSLRLISCGGAGVTAAHVDRFKDELGASVKRTYGSTEAPTVTTSHVGDPDERARDTDGRVVGEVQLRIVGPQDRSHRSHGEVGELLVRGPELFVGYTDGAATAAALDRDGWFRTGDLASLDREGWLTVRGRLDDTIVRGGENISPVAVEAACVHLPGARNVVAVGVPDERLGHRVALVVEATVAPSMDQVRDACEAAGLPRFAWPESVVRVDAIPLLTVGKPDRRGVADLVARAI